jgi:hypothetical protein
MEESYNGKNPWVLFKIESPQFNNDKTPESQLYYLIQGETSVYPNFVAIKSKNISDDFFKKWASIFKNSKLKFID